MWLRGGTAFFHCLLPCLPACLPGLGRLAFGRLPPQAILTFLPLYVPTFLFPSSQIPPVLILLYLIYPLSCHGHQSVGMPLTAAHAAWHASASSFSCFEEVGQEDSMEWMEDGHLPATCLHYLLLPPLHLPVLPPSEEATCLL